ncbi:hypothetical protein WAK64_11220 [Bacillus spongiae]|uniref:DUF5668 domain-containing protein n=1 Tax=Bacillus spongiae TaxID=2683610 RepID=A0ABU8HE34_9BACI
MRTWRVGTFSMGGSLLFLGILLLLTQILHWETAFILVSWWPVLFIVLGIEILLYLFLSRSEKAFLKYDFLSIIFVGFIGMVGIGLTVVQTTGLLEHVTSSFNNEVATANLPAFNKETGTEIKRIVVDTGDHPLTIETSTDKEISIFGTYRTQYVDRKPLLEEVNDYLFTKIKGDTIFITFKDLPQRNEWTTTFHSLEATLVVPASASLEVESDNAITLKPRKIVSSWNIENSSNVSLDLTKAEDVTVRLRDIQHIEGDEIQWTYPETREGQQESNEVDLEEHRTSATYKIGSGEQSISITDAYSVHATVSP